MLVIENFGRSNEACRASTKNRLRITCAKWRHSAQYLEQLWSDGLQRKVSIDAQHRLKICQRELRTSVLVQLNPELSHPRTWQRKSHSMSVAAVPREQTCA